jgi:predicted permease
MAFALRIGIPCLLFRAIAGVDLGAVFDPGLLVSFYAGAVIAFALGVLGARRLFKRRPGEAVAIGFCALFSNTVLLGLPIMERAYGAGALAPNYAIISIHAPFCYLLGITMMEISRADGRGAFETARAVMRAMFSNALMIGLMLGFAVNLAQIAIPAPVQSGLDMIADAALPAALFGLGGILTRYGLRDSVPEATMVSVLSLLEHPAIVFGLAQVVFGLPEGFVRSAVVAAAMAPGVNVYVFATQYNRGRAVAASSVLLGTALSVLSVSLWLVVLGGVN